MTSFNDLMEVARRLNDPHHGCPWDVQQTFASLQKYILEEACELIDAVDDHDIKGMIEELGDLLYVVIFYCKVAERDKIFNLDDVLKVLIEKLIRRHPHVFKEQKATSIEEIQQKWIEIKQEEKKERVSALDGIPRSLTALARAQKVLAKLIEHECEELRSIPSSTLNETTLGDQILQLVLQAEHQGFDAERALRKAITKYEDAFKAKEKR